MEDSRLSIVEILRTPPAFCRQGVGAGVRSQEPEVRRASCINTGSHRPLPGPRSMRGRAPPRRGIGFRIKRGDASNGGELRSLLVAQTSPRKFRLPPKFPAPPRHREGHAGAALAGGQALKKRPPVLFHQGKGEIAGRGRLSESRVRKGVLSPLPASGRGAATPGVAGGEVCARRERIRQIRFSKRRRSLS